jgi:hypothetical protein
MVQGSIPGGIKRFFFSPGCPVRLWGSPGPLFSGYRGTFEWEERPVREADHSPSSRAEVKNRWRYNSTSPYAFMAWTEFMLCYQAFSPHHRLANDILAYQRTCVVWFYERHPSVVMNLQQIITFLSNTPKLWYLEMTTTCFGLKKTFIRASLKKLKIRNNTAQIMLVIWDHMRLTR